MPAIGHGSGRSRNVVRASIGPFALALALTLVMLPAFGQTIAGKQRTDGELPTVIGPGSGAYKQQTIVGSGRRVSDRQMEVGQAAEAKDQSK